MKFIYLIDDKIMSTERVVYVAKTNLNTDGRILNQIKILNDNLPFTIHFILFPDSPTKLDLGNKVHLYEISSWIRHNRYLQAFTVLIFTWKTIKLLFKLNPTILHAQDTAVVLPTLIYRALKGRTFKLIYDDHEIPNENESFSKRIMNVFEILLMKASDHVVFANEERMDILIKKHNLTNSSSFFLNLPYYEEERQSVTDTIVQQILDQIDTLIESGYNFIIHQGVLEKERGREKLAKFSRIIPKNWKILLLGGSQSNFQEFLKDHRVWKESFFFVGKVNYHVLPEFWDRGKLSIVMYLPTYINNRLCAPNRFYISLQKNIPVLVNKDNPVLSNFIEKMNCGKYIEDLMDEDRFVAYVDNINYEKILFDDIKNEQVSTFLKIYE